MCVGVCERARVCGDDCKTKTTSCPDGSDPGRHSRSQAVLPTVPDRRQVLIEGLIERHIVLQFRPVPMQFLQTVVAEILVRQVELVGEQFRSAGQPGGVPDTVHTDASDHLPVAGPVTVQTKPVLGPDYWMV